MKRKFLLLIGIIMTASLMFGLVPAQVSAAKDTTTGGTTGGPTTSGDITGSGTANSNSNSGSGGGCNSGGFLGFRAWYDGLPCENGAIKAPKNDATGASIAGFIWTIVANVLVDLFMVVGFLATGFLMYGGYLYIMSNGDPNKTASGMKTIKAAVIGLIIAILANVTIRTILTILGL